MSDVQKIKYYTDQHYAYYITHKNKVADNFSKLLKLDIGYDAYANLLTRSNKHDISKVEDEEEKSGYIYMSAELEGVKYGSEKYNQIMSKYKKFVDMHYKNNSHHPEHYELPPFSCDKGQGYTMMSVFDKAEMICDWCAVIQTKNLEKDYKNNLEINKKRFNIPDSDFKQILQIAEYLLFDKPLICNIFINELKTSH